ncbi:MAG: carboxylating nicotinate-nucleotide diphosphorylase [Planctomycetota bacterium]
MQRSHAQMAWDTTLTEDLQALLDLALLEDLRGQHDLTTNALVPPHAQGRAHVVARVDGVVAGIKVGQLLAGRMHGATSWQAKVEDGVQVQAGDQVAVWEGAARTMLTGERTLLNVLGHLSGIASQTHRFADAVRGTGAQICDTRKTLPGWRRLQKYAVQCGGGCNHRMGLFDAVLIKDNHLCFRSQAAAIDLAAVLAEVKGTVGTEPIIEVEVDTLDQLRQVLPAEPDIVLLDNMNLEQLRQAVTLRGEIAPHVALEASGGVQLETVQAIAATGVERISVGALTHSVTAMDLALDWDG